MTKMLLSRTFAVVGLLLCKMLVLAQDEESYSGGAHLLTDMPGSHDSILTSYYFPEHQDLKFPAGATIEVLCLLVNTWEAPINVTGVMGSLNLPDDFSRYVYNFTYEPIDVVVSPNSEITLMYSFWLHPQLSPTEYAIAHSVFYEDGYEAFSSTFFNQTIEIYSTTGDGSAQEYLLSISAVLSTAGIAALFYFLVCASDKTRKTRGTAHSKAKNPTDDDSWVTPPPRPGKKRASKKG